MMESSSLQWEAMLCEIEAEKLVGIKAVWKFLDACRGNLVLETQKLEFEKRLFESDRAAALKQIYLDSQLEFQHKVDHLVRKLDEASNLLQSRKLKIANQSKYIKLLEDKLENNFGAELPIIMEETIETLLESTEQNVSIDSDPEDDQIELQLAIEQKKNEKLFYESRIAQLEADVIRLAQERDQLKVQSAPAHQPEFHVLKEKDILFPLKLQIKEQDNYEEPASRLTEPLDDVSEKLHSSDSSGLETEDFISSVLSVLNSSQANEEIVYVIKTSSSQFTTALISYNKILNNSFIQHQPTWIQNELLETCNTNLQCLEAIQSYLKSSYENVDLKKSVKDLMKKWVLLDAKLFRLLQKDT